MSILDELYEWYEMRAGLSPRVGEMQKQFGNLWQEAEKALGEDLSEKLRSSIFDYMDEECTQDFQAGFRLGAQLMLELYSTAAPQQSPVPSAARQPALL